MPPELDQDICRAILDSLSTGVYLIDRERRIRLWNDGAEAITGYLRQDVIGRYCHDNLLMHCDDSNRLLCGVACPLAQTIADGRPREANLFLRHKDGERVPVRVKAVAIRDASGAIIGAAESFEEQIVVPDLEAISHAAIEDRLDELTGTPDHDSTCSHIIAGLTEFNEYHIPFGVLIVAVDKMDELAHKYGRPAADSMLRMIALTLIKNLRPADMVGRWEDGKFVAIVTNCPGPGLTRVSEMLKQLISVAGIPWWGDWISSTVSIGGASAQSGDTAESLLKRADEALGASIRLGGDQISIC